MIIQGHSIGEDIFSLGARLSDVESSMSVVGDRIVYVTPHGNDANDGLSWGTSKLTVVGGVAGLAGNPGVVQLGAGIISTGGAVDLSGRVGVTVRGLGGISSGVAPTTIVRHTVAGAGAIVNLQNSTGCCLKDFMLQYTNALFTGTIVDCSNPAGTDTNLFVLDGMYIGSSGGLTTAAVAVSLDKAIDGVINRCVIQGAAVGVLGRSAAGTYSNGIALRSCQFIGNTTCHVSNIGQGWSIDNVIFEGLSGGGAGAIVNSAGVTALGGHIVGCWMGDVTAGVGGSQISVPCSGLVIAGNYIGFNNSAKGVVIGAASSGFSIVGNTLAGGGTADQAIDLGAGCVDYTVSPNNIVTVATRMGASPTAIRRAVTDQDNAFAWVNNANSATSLSVGTNGVKVGIGTATPNSFLQVLGPIARKTQLINVATGQAGSHSTVRCDATGGAFAYTLSTAVGQDGRRLTVVKTDASGNAVTVATSGGQTISGAASIVLGAQWKYVVVESDGANWIEVGKN